MRIFLDTNVIVSAVATRGLCADVLREVLLRHQLIISTALIDELKRVLKRKIGVPENFINEIVELVQQDAYHVHDSELPDITIADKDDSVLLGSAVQAQADLFVTGDRELLELKSVEKMEIVSPRDFWKRLQ